MRFINNAGGNSVLSEILSYTYLHENYGATLINTEMELQYSAICKIADYSVNIQGKTYGCSVTRCFNYLDLESKVDKDKMHKLLYKKIDGLHSARENMVGEKWNGLILHIIVPNSKIVKQIVRALRCYDQTISYIITVVKFPVIYFEKPAHIQHVQDYGLTNIDKLYCLMPKEYGMTI